MKSVDVIIMAGGLGTRLRSVISELPKCMAPVCEKPFLSYLLEYLRPYNTNKVILSVGYLREHIFKFIDEVKCDYPYEFDYAIEETPLGTGGGTRLALKKATMDNVVILNGDTLFNVNLDLFLDSHLKSGKDLSIALKPMENFERYGNVIIDDGGRIVEFQEKQYCAKGYINGGVSIINRNTKLMEGCPEKFSFEVEIMQKQAREMNLNGYISDGYFIDIGIPEDYAKANREFDKLSFL